MASSDLTICSCWGSFKSGRCLVEDNCTSQSIHLILYSPSNRCGTSWGKFQCIKHWFNVECCLKYCVFSQLCGWTLFCVGSLWLAWNKIWPRETICHYSVYYPTLAMWINKSIVLCAIHLIKNIYNACRTNQPSLKFECLKNLYMLNVGIMWSHIA